MEALPGHKLRFSFGSSVVDQSLVKGNECFAADYYEMHAVVWDSRSQQYLCIIGESSPIRYPPGTRNRWARPTPFACGADYLNPQNWANEHSVSRRAIIGRLSPTQISRVAHWAQQVDKAQESDTHEAPEGEREPDLETFLDEDRKKVELAKLQSIASANSYHDLLTNQSDSSNQQPNDPSKGARLAFRHPRTNSMPATSSCRFLLIEV